LDLFFCHRPDPNTPIEETVRAMDDLIHQDRIQVAENMKAIEVAPKLTTEVIEPIEQALKNKPRQQEEWSPTRTKTCLNARRQISSRSRWT
jgi:aryl-alcohol dehydrogenase-like predicted oxidoreductase